MWSPLSKLLETIGSVRFPWLRLRKRLTVGDPRALDARGTGDWRYYLDPRTLSNQWGPHLNSPWRPFHCLTLFAAIDYLKHQEIGPYPVDPWPVAAFAPPGWIDSKTLIMADLPGPPVVALGAALGAMGCDLVCTFNNWPHPKGVLKVENTLAALLRYASWLGEKRIAYPTPGPVVWLCDADRISARPGIPGDFDNRYYIEDGIIPGPHFLRAQGISKIIYISYMPGVLLADISAHLHEYDKQGFLVGQSVAGDNGSLSYPEPFKPSAKLFSKTGFFRSSAGGFGGPVPHPSSGG